MICKDAPVLTIWVCAGAELCVRTVEKFNVENEKKCGKIITILKKDMKNLEFRQIDVSDIERLRAFDMEGENSCENDVVNMLVWQKAYGNEIAFFEDMLFIRSFSENGPVYRLPMGDDFRKGMKMLYEYVGGDPIFWAQEGARLSEFRKEYSDKYDFFEVRDAFDYIYEREALASLSGKKYHGKRNHISSFSKKHQWHYEPISADNIVAVRECAAEWYEKNAERMDKYMRVERDGIELLLDNMERLRVRGGAIVCDGRVVAFTLGSQINREVFDIHIEKALPDYAEAYTVINNEFVRNELTEYKYVNREDDLGLEGLRRAKLSYRPAILLKKYRCIPKENL